MRAEFITKGFDKTESMDDFLREHCLALVDSYLKNEKDVHLRVSIDEDSHRNQARKPHFVCEFQIKTAGSRKYLKTHKTSSDFYNAVNGAVKAMKHILQKRSDRRHDLKSTPGTITAA
ncbi:MAG: HPF/RaiA family ribosome-associated protein [Pseudobdellovibrionaceae bacterium]